MLHKYNDDLEQPEVVRQTCELAIAKILHEQSKVTTTKTTTTTTSTTANTTATTDAPISGKYSSVDPAPPLPDAEEHSTRVLETILLDAQLPLFERYRAMFSLRDRGGRDAVLSLAKGFRDSSALFRHEIAYVFGQMQDPDSVPALKEVGLCCVGLGSYELVDSVSLSLSLSVSLLFL